MSASLIAIANAFSSATKENDEGETPLPPDEAQKLAHAITRAVCKTFGLPRSALHFRMRTARLAAARAVAIYLVRKECRYSAADCARFFGLHHTTVLAAFAKIEALTAGGGLLKEELELLKLRARAFVAERAHPHACPTCGFERGDNE